MDKRVTMATYAIQSMNVPLHDGYDVIVAGGGPAGSTAAAAAAREGARTLLVESTGALGGMGTGGLVPAWCPFSDKEKIIYRGLAEKVFNALKAAMPHVAASKLDWVPIDPESLKRILDELVTGAGAEVLFGTTLCGIEKEDDDKAGTLITAGKGGLAAYRASVYVDCTGDGDLAAWAGAEFDQGDDSGEMQPASHCFILANVDEEAFLSGPNIEGGNPKSPVYEMAASDEYPLIRDGHLCCHLIGPGTVGFNAGHLWDVDGTDPASLSRALIEGRKLAAQFRDGLAKYHPKAFGKAFLAETGALLGIRETRRIVGDYVLTLADYLARRSFPDEICRNSYFIDVHTAKAEIAQARRGKEHIEKRTHRYGPGESHGVPYRCLTPKGLRNVLVAGRSISCDRAVQGSVRVMPVCLAMGEAAGAAAVQAVRGYGGDVHAVDVERLRAHLIEEGAYLPSHEAARSADA
jgi:hypothetical protein